MKPIVELQSDDPSNIYCIGDNRSILKLEVAHMNWMKLPVDNDEKSQDAFDATLRYSSSCFLPPCPKERIIMTGGCFLTNGFPSNHVCEFTISNIRKPKKKRGMIMRRYGHVSVYLNSMVYAIGGFSHKDLPHEPPVTLAACERMNANAEQKWCHVNSMNEPRAFASYVTFNS